MESVPLAFSAGDASDRTEKRETRILAHVVAAFLVLFLLAILALPSHCSIFHHTHNHICNDCPSRGDLGRQFAAPVDGPKPEKAHMEGKHEHVKRLKKAKAAKPPKIHQGEGPPAAAK